MKRNLINIILIGVLLIQVLPVSEMGEMLFDNQLNEEINCSGASIKELSKCNDSYVDNQEPMVQYDPNVHIGLNSSYVAFQTFIPVHHTSDVPVPPPNKLFV
jgi:hypothetical protein